MKNICSLQINTAMSASGIGLGTGLYYIARLLSELNNVNLLRSPQPGFDLKW